jgi:cell division protein ZapA
METPRVIMVDIHGQRYPIRSELDPDYVAELARYVDEKMRAAARETPSGETLKVAVLAALNIADEFFRCRTAGASQQGLLAERAREIEALVDRLLAGA